MTSESQRERLLREIADARRRSEALARDQAQLESRLAQLRAELSTLNLAVSSTALKPSADTRVPTTSTEKIALFRSLFRGRDDVYPTRFVSKKTQKAGYAPACHNKFVPGVCDLPRVKCSECQNQAFMSADDAAVLAHLTGRHVMGVYPLLENDTCWFLAVDFDKSTWVEDVRAFAATCQRHSLPIAIERSRSGNGAHVWFFFKTAMVVGVARKMGTYLLTQTMTNRYELSMESYDRLFPSQDTLPRGGFGNLIALPLQHAPRQQGNSIFLDENLQAIPDDKQWAYLASVQRVDPAAVVKIAERASQEDAELGVPAVEFLDEKNLTPWLRGPRSTPKRLDIATPLPPSIPAVLADKLYVPKEGLPAALLTAVKRLAAFQNPEFYKKQSMRLSTALTPRVIACAEDLPLHVALPRGCAEDLQALLDGLKVHLNVEDLRSAGTPMTASFLGSLTDSQEKVKEAVLAHEIGVIVAPPGSGKTVIGINLIATRARNTLVLVHRRSLLDQWRAQLAVFLSVDPKEIGQIGAGKNTGTGRLDVGMLQSLISRGDVNELVTTYGHVIVDECHHLPAVSFERILGAVKARYILGLTATPQRRDGHQRITEMQLGPIRYAIHAKSKGAALPFKRTLWVRETGFHADPAIPQQIQSLYAALALDADRNRLILDDVIRSLEEGRSPIVLTERTDHLEFLATSLKSFARHMVVLRGGTSNKERRAAVEQLAAIPDNQERLLLATGRYVGEGFDDARLDTLFLTLPVSWKGTLIQYAGRLHRQHKDKSEVRIVDYVDRKVPMLLSMFSKRIRGYRAIGYARGESPLGFTNVDLETVVDYDEAEILKSCDYVGSDQNTADP